MKRLVEESVNSLESLLGESVLIFCCNYFYTGKLVGVNDSVVELDNAKIVYETGPFGGDKFSYAEFLPTKRWYIQTRMIESFGICHKE